MSKRVLLIAALLLASPPARAVDREPFPLGDATELLEPPPVDTRIEIHALCDGVTDDTAAFRDAIERAGSMGVAGHRVGVLRRGTAQNPAVCLVSDALMQPTDQGVLRWRTGPQPLKPEGIWQYGWSFIGPCKTCVSIKLMDHQSKFQDRTNPRAIIYMASQWIGGTDPLAFNVTGEGARGFDNFLRGLTIDCGNENPGCVAVDGLMNNVGGLRDVRLIGTSGYAGIRFERYGPGPALIASTDVLGFDYGMRIRHLDYGITLERTQFIGQRIAGIDLDSNALSMYLHRSINAVPGLVIHNAAAHVVSIDSKWEGGASDAAAIENPDGAYLMTRWLQGGAQVTGYGALIAGQNLAANTPEYFSHPVQRPFPPATPQADRSLRIPIRSPLPAFHTANQKRWASCDAHGCDAGGLDDWDSMQSMFDSVQEIAFFGTGPYSLANTVFIPAHKRTIRGIQSIINPNTTLAGRPAWVVVPPAPGEPVTPLSIIGMHMGAGQFEQRGSPVLVIPAGRPVYIQDSTIGRMQILAGAEVYVSNVLFVAEIGPGARVYGAQCNTEAALGPFVRNDGGTFVCVGVKMENIILAGEHGDIWTETLNGGQTELLGGDAFTLHTPDTEHPVHIVRDGGCFFGAWTESIRTNPPPPIEVFEQRGDLVGLILGRAVEGLVGAVLPQRGATPGRQAFVRACP